MNSLILGAIFYLADYVLQINTMILLAFLFIPLIIGVPITTLIRARIGVVQTQQVLLLIAGIGLLLVAVLPTSMIPLCIALAGFGLSGPQTLTNVLFAQVADEDELRSGVRREGAFFGVNALITKPAQSDSAGALSAYSGGHSFCHARSKCWANFSRTTCQRNLWHQDHRRVNPRAGDAARRSNSFLVPAAR